MGLPSSKSPPSKYVPVYLPRRDTEIEHISSSLAPQTGTLESLITLSEELPKQDSIFTQTIAKIVDILRNLLNNDPSKLSQHILVEERPLDEYLLKGWSWNEGRYVLHKSLKEIVDTLARVCALSCTTLCKGSPFIRRN